MLDLTRKTVAAAGAGVALAAGLFLGGYETGRAGVPLPAVGQLVAGQVPAAVPAAPPAPVGQMLVCSDGEDGLLRDCLTGEWLDYEGGVWAVR